MRKLEYTCAECGTLFHSKPTGREHWQEDRFCSTKCGNKKRKREFFVNHGGREPKKAQSVR